MCRLKPVGRWVVDMLAVLGVIWLGGGCDFQPLTGRDLFGARDAAADLAPTADAAGDNASDNASDGAPSDEAPQTCAVPCGATEFCDELTGRCAARTGNSMLSGVVRDTCTRVGLDALVGIAGHHQCSAAGKGSFFFAQLPVGKLKLAAVKTGYRLFDTTVVVAPGGTIQDIGLVPDGSEGCAAPRPADVMCMCVAPQCLP
jgi:hypothetical protein